MTHFCIPGKFVRTEIKAQNEFLFSAESIRITAVAIQVRVSNADTDMPVFFGLDDVIIRAKSDPSFVFTVPEVAVLSEWPERMPLKHYRPGDELVLEGMFDTDISPDGSIRNCLLMHPVNSSVFMWRR